MKSIPGDANANDDPRFVIIGTAGHIDHGKTALVHALTGTDTDRLPEEKQRGITIDLGFAALDLDHPSRGRLHLSIIDVPGHHAFIRNMLAGTGGIDCVMLVVAADEGVKAQTEEHLDICNLLGIKRGLVVLTKSDAVTREHLLQVRESVRRFLESTFLERAPILAVSAKRGDGIAELRIALAEMAASVPARSVECVPRLPLDRSFSMRGFGTVVTGTLHAGVLHAGGALEQHPAGRVLRVRGMQVHGIHRETASAPCRVALNVSGVEAAQVARGDTLTIPGTLAATSTVDVELTMLRDAPAIKHGSRVRVHAFTSDTLARFLFFDQKNSREKGSGLARLRLAGPLLLLPGDRLVLRQCSPEVTIGGGRVLDTTAPVALRKSAAFEWLQRMKCADPAEQLRLRVVRRTIEGIGIDALVMETGFAEETLLRRMAPLTESGSVVNCAPSNGAGAHWIAAESLADAVQAAERAVADAGSLSRAELRSKLQLDATVFGAVLQRLIAGKHELAGDAVKAAGKGDSIPEAKKRQMQAIEEVYSKAGLAAPLLSEVSRVLSIGPEAMRETITLLLRSRRLVRMGADDTFVHPQALERLYEGLRRHRGENFDVARFKSFTGLTRKHAIPLLEHLDKVRVTRNNGGMRIVL